MNELLTLGGAVAPRPILRAFRLTEAGWPPILNYLARCQELACLPQGVLIDAHLPGQYGGTGLACDWNGLAGWRSKLGEMPLVLAGGLKPDNVAQAIGIVQPVAVDTASGVENFPGRKDPAMMRAFATAALAALSQSAYRSVQ